LKDGKYDHIEKVELEKTCEMVNAKLEWLNTKIADQHALPKYAPLAVTSGQIDSELIVSSEIDIEFENFSEYCDQ
jgi:hypothetical protein